MSIYDDAVKKRGSIYDRVWKETIGGSAPSPSYLAQQDDNKRFLDAVNKRQDAYRERQFEKWLKERDEQIKKEREEQIKKEEQERKEAARRKKDKEELSVFEAIGEGFKGFGTGVKNIFDGDPDTTFFGGGAKKMLENTEGQRQSDFLSELNRGATRVSNAATLGTLNETYKRTRGERHQDFTSEGRSGVGKAADIGYDILGSLIPGTGAAKLSRNLIKRPTTWKGKAMEGAALGGAYSGAEIGIRESLNGEDYSAKDNAIELALNIGAGAVIDPIADVLIGKITSKLKQGIDPETIAREEGVSPESVEKVSRKIVRGTLDGQEVVGPRSGKELPPPVNVMRDPLGLGGRTSNTPSLPRMGLPEPIITNRFKSAKSPTVNGTPLLDSNPLSSQLESFRNRELDADDFRELLNLGNRTQSSADSFLDNFTRNDKDFQKMEQLNKQVGNIQAKWEAVKESQRRASEMRDRIGKIYVPKDNQADWLSAVPKRFRASKSAKGNKDIYKASQDEGFESVDEFVIHLQDLDNTLRTKLADLLPEGMDRHSMKRTMDELVSKEGQLKDEGRNTKEYRDMESALSQIDEIISKQNEKPLRFAKEIGSRRDPLSFVARNDKPKAERFEGEFSTRQVDTPSGDTLRMDVKPKQTEAHLDDLIFKTQQEQRPFKTQMEKEFGRKDIIEKDGRNRASQGDSDAINSGQTDNRLRMNLQAFDGKKEKLSDSLVSKTDPKDSKGAVEQIKGKVRRIAHKGYEQIVNKRHSLHIADKLRTENALDVAIRNGNKKAAETLSNRLAQIKKKGSQIEKAATNEETAHVMTSSMLERGFNPIQKIWKEAGISTKEGIHYQLAKNIRYILDNVNPKYQLPKGWDAGRINQIINAAEFGSKKEAFKQQTDGFKEMMGDVRQFMLDYDLKPKEEIDLLAENPFYIPMFRDRDWMADNVARATAGRKSSTSNSVLDLYGLEGGDMQNYLKNPLESIAELTHMVVRKGLQNDTALELKKLADIEETTIKSLGDNVGDNYDNILVRRVRNGETPDIVGIENGEKFGLKLQGDLQDVINEGRDITIPSNFVAKLTRGYADLKTSSLAHQIVAAPRDMIQGYYNSQIRDPFRYMTEMVRVIKDSNADAKRLGAYFEKGYNAQTGGEKNHQKMIQDFVKENKGVTLADPKSWLKLPKNILLGPGRFLGEVSDRTMRSIEVRETERKFAPLIKDAEKRLAEARKGGDFSEQTRGIAEIQQELKDLRKQMRRESTYEGRDMMNYSRTGRAGWVQNIVKPYMVFANTTTQSKDRFFRQLKRDPMGTIGKVSVPIAGMFAFQQMAYNDATSEDKEVMDLAPDYVRDYYYMFPDGNGKVWMVPKPHEAIPIIKGIEAAGEKYFNTRENVPGDPMNEWYRHLIQEYVPLQAGNLLKGFAPDRYGEINPQTDSTLPGTVATPLIDMMLNDKTSFNRKPVSGDNPYPQKGEDGYNPDEGSLIIPKGDTQDEFSAPWTPAYAKAIGGDKVNADYIDHFLKDVLGDYSSAARTTADSTVTGENPLIQLLQDLTVRKINREGYKEREKEKILFPERFEN